MIYDSPIKIHTNTVQSTVPWEEWNTCYSLFIADFKVINTIYVNVAVSVVQTAWKLSSYSNEILLFQYGFDTSKSGCWLLRSNNSTDVY